MFVFLPVPILPGWLKILHLSLRSFSAILVGRGCKACHLQEIFALISAILASEKRQRPCLKSSVSYSILTLIKTFFWYVGHKKLRYFDLSYTSLAKTWFSKWSKCFEIHGFMYAVQWEPYAKRQRSKLPTYGCIFVQQRETRSSKLQKKYIFRVYIFFRFQDSKCSVQVLLLPKQPLEASISRQLSH